MPSGTTFVLFCAAALALIVVPGPAVTYVVAQSLDKGRRAGLVSALGIACGGLVHVAAAVAGLSALIASSASAFTVVKLVGAAYLIVIGLWHLAGRGQDDAQAPQPVAARRLFWQGALVNVLNPKTALFFLAFLPQFVDPDAGYVALQLACFGLVFVALGLVTDSLYALAAGTAGGWLRSSRFFVGARRWVSGTVFIGLGLATALSGSRQKH
jgi:threonine/homoserine/homoserine lactone efflux protein